MIPSVKNPFEPDDVNVHVWRYGQLWKLLYAIEHRVLWFTLLDVLKRDYDPFEAAVPVKTKESDMMIRGSSQDMRQIRPMFDPYCAPPHHVVTLMPTIEQRRKGLLRSAYACCWRYGHESDAMWQLYCGRDDGVVIQTTYAKLRDSITDPDVRIAVVNYIDYETEAFAQHSTYRDPAIHKRVAFDYEQEVRLLRCVDDDFRNAGQNEKFSAPLYWEMQWPTIDGIIDQIVVHPRLGERYFRIVQSAVGRVSSVLANKVQRSRLSHIPTY